MRAIILPAPILFLKDFNSLFIILGTSLGFATHDLCVTLILSITLALNYDCLQFPNYNMPGFAPFQQIILSFQFIFFSLPSILIFPRDFILTFILHGSLLHVAL